MDNGPIFVAGSERSGTTLMYALLASHPNIAMTRRTNFWPYFYNQYGDLSRPANFERCLAAMLRYNRILLVQPDPDRLRREFWQGKPSYGRLFGLLQQHHAERMGKSRWGDKSLDTERYADAIFAEYPTATILHMIRDPRDRYSSAISRWQGGRSRVGGGTAVWLTSARLARRHLQKYPERYRIVRYEALVSNTEETLREICDFIREPFVASMLKMDGAAAYRDKGANSSYGPQKPGEFFTGSIGRFRRVLSHGEIRFMQTFTGSLMADFGYSPDPVNLPIEKQLRYLFVECPASFTRMVGWQALESMRDLVGRKPSQRRLVPLAS